MKVVQRELLEKAAELCCESLENYVIRVALERAEHDLALDAWATKQEASTP